MLDQIPQPLKILAVVVILLTGFACLGYLVWTRRRSDTTSTTAARTRMGAHDARMEAHGKRMGSPDQPPADPDKPPYQPPTPGLPPTSGMRAIGKLPGQDRLTRMPGAEQAVQTDAIPAVPDDHLSGDAPRLQRADPPLAAGQPPTARSASSAEPAPPATTAMPALGRPAVPGTTGPDRSHQPPLFPTARQPAPPRETRQQRRERMERLALERADQDRQRDDDRPAESPQDDR